MKRTIDVAFVTEDAAAINAEHDAVFNKQLFAVDAPDGEHDLEDLVNMLPFFFFFVQIISLSFVVSVDSHTNLCYGCPTFF